METVGHESSFFPGNAYDEQGRAIPGTWWEEIFDDSKSSSKESSSAKNEPKDTAPATTELDDDPSTPSQEYGKSSAAESDGNRPSEVNQIPLSEQLRQGEAFWAEALGMPEGTHLELGARQAMLGSFFEMTDVANEYSSLKEKYPAYSPAKVTAFGLKIPAVFDSFGDETKLYPFTDEARQGIHARIVSALEKDQTQSGLDEDQFWGTEVNYWEAPLAEAIYERNYAQAEAATNRKIKKFWREKTKFFGNNPIGKKASYKQIEDFHQHLVDEQVMSRDEINLVLGFDQAIDSMAKELTDELVAPVWSEYLSFRTRYGQIEKEYRQAIALYNERNPKKSLSPFANSGTAEVRSGYKAHLAQKSQEVSQYYEQIKDYIKSVKSTPPGTKVTPPPKPPKKIISPREIIGFTAKKELDAIARYEQREQVEQYAKESDFPYRETVLGKLKKGAKQNPVPFDVFTKKHLRTLGVEDDADTKGIEAKYAEFEELLDNFKQLRVTYAQAETMWGPAPTEVTRVCRAFQKQAKDELAARQPAERAKASQEFAQIEVGLATNLGLIESSESSSAHIVATPTGLMAKVPGQPVRNIAVSPFDQRIIAALPDDFVPLWQKTWRKYEKKDSRGNKISRDYDKKTILAVRQLIESNLKDYLAAGDSPESLLASLQKQYHFVVNGLVDKNTGRINPQLDAAEVEAASKIMPYFGDFIYAVKKPRVGEKVTLKSVQKEIVDHLSGAEKSSPKQLVRGGVLNIDTLKQLVAQDEPGAELTINLLANSLGVSMYNSLMSDERKDFDQIVAGKTDVSRKSFYQAFGNMVDDSERRSELMKRVLFASYFGQYVVGKAPEPFIRLMEKIAAKNHKT